jgi:predicted small lipoprotein YifL
MRLLALAVVLTMISACGQKGPLYLPPRNGTVVTRPGGSNAPPLQEQTPTPQSAPSSQTPPDAQSTDTDAATRKNTDNTTPTPK